MVKKILYTTLFIAVLFSSSLTCFSQEDEIISPYVLLQYFKNTDNQKFLKGTLTYSFNRMEVPLPGMELSFYSGVDYDQLLGTGITDEKGVVQLELTDEMELATDSEGMWNFMTEFSGNDTIEYGSYEIPVKDVYIEVTYTEPDSIKTINVKAYTLENGNEQPVTDELVSVVVPRMFSMLPVGEVYLDDTGTGYMEFPSDLPGGKDGIITVITKFDDNYTYGTVEKTSDLAWGVPTEYSVPLSHRALWTKTPPKWMIYTLSILLAGVWGHYLFAIISLIRISRDAKENEQFS